MYSSTILKLDPRWKRVINFTPLPLYPRGNSLRSPLDRKLGEPQSRCERYGEEKHLPLPGIEARFLSRAARRPVAVGLLTAIPVTSVGV
jgi:hypothetical protein